MLAPRSLLRAHFPRSRLPPRLLIQEENNRPDLLLGQKIFPRRHRRIPRRAFTRESRPTLGDAPEYEALRQLSDRSVVLEVGRERIQTCGVVALTVEMIAVAGNAILIVDPVPQREVRGHVAAAAQRVFQTNERNRLAAEGDLRRRCRMDRTETGR